MARKKELAIALVTSREKSPVTLVLNRWTLFASGLVLLILLGLAAVTVYNMLDSQGARGSNLSSIKSSSTTREQEQEKLIKLGEDRLVELQRENSARKKDVDDLEQRVAELSNSLKTLQQLAKDIEQRIPSGSAPQGQAPVQSTPGGGLSQPGLGGLEGTASNPAPLSVDYNQSRTYSAQVSKATSEITNLNKIIANGRLNIATLDIQVESYRATLTQQKNLAQSDLTRLSQLAGADGISAPRNLPANCAITSPFGMRQSPFVAGRIEMHYGIDIGCYEGTPVPVTKAGIVTYTGYDAGYGHRVEVTHAGGWRTVYAHNNRILVRVGQSVQKGDILSLSGNTGASTGPHIHYEVHYNGVPVDPARYLAGPQT